MFDWHWHQGEGMKEQKQFLEETGVAYPELEFAVLHFDRHDSTVSRPTKMEKFMGREYYEPLYPFTLAHPRHFYLSGKEMHDIQTQAQKPGGYHFFFQRPLGDIDDYQIDRMTLLTDQEAKEKIRELLSQGYVSFEDRVFNEPAPWMTLIQNPKKS